MTRVSTGRTVTLRDSMRVDSTAPAQAAPKQVGMMETSTCRVSDSRYSIFIEIRERGQDSVVARSAIDLPRVVHRGRPASYRGSRNYGYSNPLTSYREEESSKHINVLADIKVGDWVECYITPKTGTLSVRPAKMQNVCTPYVLTLAEKVTPELEVFFSVRTHAVVATLKRRESFTRDTYAIASSSDEPIHKISALRAMEQLFIALIAADRIDRAVAEKKYEVYEKLSGLIWKGGTPGEQVAAFTRAWEILAKVTNVRNAEEVSTEGAVQ